MPANHKAKIAAYVEATYKDDLPAVRAATVGIILQFHEAATAHAAAKHPGRPLDATIEAMAFAASIYARKTKEQVEAIVDNVVKFHAHATRHLMETKTNSVVAPSPGDDAGPLFHRGAGRRRRDSCAVATCAASPELASLFQGQGDASSFHHRGKVRVPCTPAEGGWFARVPE
jgi:hypothetical protein